MSRKFREFDAATDVAARIILEAVFQGVTMSEIVLSQAEANALIAMRKICVNDEKHVFPPNNESLIIPLTSEDRHEHFILDIYKSRFKLAKITYQNRVRKDIILVRLDVGGSPHRNPDDEVIPCPHLHVYREGFGDKWAVPIPNLFTDPNDTWQTLYEFLDYCTIVDPPKFDRNLFP